MPECIEYNNKMCRCDNTTSARDTCFAKSDEITDDLLSCPQLPFSIAYCLIDACKEDVRDVEADPVPQIMDMLKYEQVFDNLYVRLKLYARCSPWAVRILLKEIELEMRKLIDLSETEFEKLDDGTK